MGWKQEFPNLRKKLIEKAGVSEASFDKRVTRLAHSKNTTPRVALFIIAKKNGVSSVREFEKLKDSEQSMVASTSSRQVTQGDSGQRSVRTSIVRAPSKPEIKRWHDKWWGKAIVALIVAIVSGIIVLIIATRAGL